MVLTLIRNIYELRSSERGLEFVQDTDSEARKKGSMLLPICCLNGNQNSASNPSG